MLNIQSLTTGPISVSRAPSWLRMSSPAMMTLIQLLARCRHEAYTELGVQLRALSQVHVPVGARRCIPGFQEPFPTKLAEIILALSSVQVKQDM